MFAYLLIAFLGMGILCDGVSAYIKIQVNQKLPKTERFSWWTRHTFPVVRKHRELFPGSPLPSIAMLSFWGTVLLFLALVGSLVYYLLHLGIHL
jgi:hypothetical protein